MSVTCMTKDVEAVALSYNAPPDVLSAAGWTSLDWPQITSCTGLYRASEVMHCDAPYIVDRQRAALCQKHLSNIFASAAGRAEECILGTLNTSAQVVLPAVHTAGTALLHAITDRRCHVCIVTPLHWLMHAQQ